MLPDAGPGERKTATPACDSCWCSYKQVFDGVNSRDAVIWNTLILGYVENGDSLIAMELLSSMDCEPNYVTYVAGLKACSALASENESEAEKWLERGISVHRNAQTCGFDSEITVANSLVNMYCNCKSVHHARKVFDEMPHRNAATWNCLILGYVKNGECLVAMGVFKSMDCEPDSFTYVAVFKACSGLAGGKESEQSHWLSEGMSIHKQVQSCGLESNLVVMNALLDMYCKFGSMQRAKEVFDRMRQRTVIAWNCLMLGYVDNGECSVAIDLFTCMDCEPSSVTYLVVLKAIVGLAPHDKKFWLQRGIETHKQVKESGFDSDVSVATTLVDMYSKCGCMQRARDVFNSMIQRTAVTWTCLILGYLENGEASVAINLFAGMDCKPSLVTYIAVLKACSSLANQSESKKRFCLEKGMTVHEEVKGCGFETDVVLATTLLDMYSKCGSMDRAREVFDKMKQRTAVTWNCLILGYVENGESVLALDSFAAMDCEPDCATYVAVLRACGGLASSKESEKNFCLEKGVEIHKQLRLRGLDSDVTVATTLIDMYSKCGSTKSARDVFDGIKQKNVVSWTSLMMGYVGNGENLSAVDLFVSMDCEPNSVTYVAALKACGSLDSAAGQQIHARVCKLGLEEEQVVANSLIDFYVKCATVCRAEALFDSMHTPDTVSWNSLIAGYSSVGDSSSVFGLARKMQENCVRMDGITFICILTTCSHAGLVEEGRMWFEYMSSRFGICPSLVHYNCVVDMLGRANKLQEALGFIRDMPFKADGVTWMTLLGACKKWRDLEVGRAAYDALVACGSREPAAYVLMSDIEGSL